MLCGCDFCHMWLWLIIYCGHTRKPDRVRILAHMFAHVHALKLHSSRLSRLSGSFSSACFEDSIRLFRFFWALLALLALLAQFNSVGSPLSLHLALLAILLLPSQSIRNDRSPIPWHTIISNLLQYSLMSGALDWAQAHSLRRAKQSHIDAMYCVWPHSLFTNEQVVFALL